MKITWRTIFSWDVSTASLSEVVERVINGYQDKGEKVRLIWVINDVMRETGVNKVLHGNDQWKFRKKGLKK